MFYEVQGITQHTQNVGSTATLQTYLVHVRHDFQIVRLKDNAVKSVTLQTYIFSFY
jgi:hypothetical protein